MINVLACKSVLFLLLPKVASARLALMAQPVVVKVCMAVRNGADGQVALAAIGSW